MNEIAFQRGDEENRYEVWLDVKENNDGGYVYQMYARKKKASNSTAEELAPVTSRSPLTDNIVAYNTNSVNHQNEEVSNRFVEASVTEDTQAMDDMYMAAVNSGDMEQVQAMLNARADYLRAEVFAQTDVPTYKIRRGAAPKKTIKVYKTFTMSKEGNPTALFVSSQYDLPVGVWLDAQNTYHFTDRIAHPFNN